MTWNLLKSSHLIYKYILWGHEALGGLRLQSAVSGCELLLHDAPLCLFLSVCLVVWLMTCKCAAFITHDVTAPGSSKVTLWPHRKPGRQTLATTVARTHTHTQTNQSEVIRRDRGARLRPGGRNTVSRVWTSSTPGLKIDFDNLIKTDFMFDFNVGAYISKIHGGMLQNYKCAAPF